MTRASACMAAAFSVSICCGIVLLAQPATETFTATASLKSGSVNAAADVTVRVNRYASDEERVAILDAARTGGSGAVRALVSAWKDTGFIQVGQLRTPIKFARRRETPSGNLITVVTGDPILFLGGGLPEPEARAGFDVAVALLDVQNSGGGVGELAPAAKVGVTEDGALLIQDYGATVLFLSAIARAR